MNHRYLRVPLLLYGVPNLLAFASIYLLDLLIIDMTPIVVKLSNTDLLLVLTSIAFSFLLVAGCLRFSGRFFPARPDPPPAAILGKIVFVIQFITLLSVVLYDYGRAGGKSGSTAALPILASYLKSDFMFLIYYGCTRMIRVPKWNLGMYIVINVMRGWSAIWLILFLIEIYYLQQKANSRKTIRIVFITIFIGLISFPFIQNLKETARGSTALEISYLGSYVKLFDRLQHTTNVALICQEAEALTQDYQSGQFSSWYADNPIALRLLPKRGDGDSLQRYITRKYLIDFESLGYYSSDLEWYTHVGIAGWLFILPWHDIPAYLLYITALLIVPYWVAGRLLRSTFVIPVIHVASFVYVLHGWLDVQVGFITALMIYTGISKLLSTLSPRQPIRTSSLGAQSGALSESLT